MEGLQQIETAKSDLAAGLASLDKEVQVKSAKNSALNEENAALAQKNAELKSDFERKSAEFSEKIAKNRGIHEKLLADIEQANKDLEKARTELKTVKKQHKDFMEYRKRANAVLESHEAAILEKEEKLDVVLSTAKRRTKILANL